MIRSIAPINLIVYYPKTEDGRMELAKQVSYFHASAVIRQIQSLTCPSAQKQTLLYTIIDTIKARSREQTSP